MVCYYCSATNLSLREVLYYGVVFMMMMIMVIIYYNIKFKLFFLY